jgi:C4-dicarboxylate-specific signal transduction histidine kinase
MLVAAAMLCCCFHLVPAILLLSIFTGALCCIVRMLADQQQAAEVELQSVVEAHTAALTAAQTELQQAKSALRSAEYSSAAATEELLQLRTRSSGMLMLLQQAVVTGARCHVLLWYYTPARLAVLRFV